MLPTLYKLTDAYNSVWNMVLDDDIDLDSIENTLQAIESAIEIKAENTAALVKQLEATAEMITAEIERLQKRKAAVKNKADRIKSYLKMQLELAGMDKVKTVAFSISLQNTKAAVDVVDQSQIPSEYIKTKIEQSIDKTAIYNAIKAGVAVPGAQLISGRSLLIR